MPAKPISLKGWGGALLVLALLVVGIPLAARMVGAQPATGADPAAPLSPQPVNSAGPLPAAGTVPAQATAAGEPLLVWLETDAELTRSVLYAAAPGQLDAATGLAEIEHLAGYPPMGAVSPDGTQIALLIAPLGANERSVRTDGSQIWVMNSDGSNLHQVASRAGRLSGWAPDGSQLAFYSLVADGTADPDAAPRTHLLVAPADGSAEPTLVIAEEGQIAIWPLGWGSTSDRLLFGQVSMIDGHWTVVEWDLPSGAAAREVELPGQPQVQTAQIPPGGEQLLLSVIEGDQASLLLVDLAAGQTQSLISAPLNGQQSSPLTGLYSANGQRLLLHEVRPDGSALQLSISAAQNLPAGSLADTNAQPASPIRPLVLSPDGGWLALRDYTASDLPLFLQRTGSTDLMPLPRSNPGNFIDVIGWLSP